jgi:hypothetical protein
MMIFLLYLIFEFHFKSNVPVVGPLAFVIFVTSGLFEELEDF